MGFTPSLIAPFKSGLENYYKPFLIGNDAFESLSNAYTYRGTLRKREGYSFLGTVPTTPVQELGTYLLPATYDELLIAISTTTAYYFKNLPIPGSFVDISFLQSAGGAFVWTGGNNDFFISCNYQNSFWTTNNVDPIRFFNGNLAGGWSNQYFQTNGTPHYVDTSLFIIPYKGRLVLLNTSEGPIAAGVRHSQRARWSQIGSAYVTKVGADPVVQPPAPYATSATADAWRDDIPGKGGYVDADTSEEIVSAAIVNDTLIVFFERSTWRLRYVGNQLFPFVWERISTEYGSESPRSSVVKENQSFSFSRWGYITANTNEVSKIDWSIIDKSFQVETGSTGEILNTVCAVRDLQKQFIYWSYPTAASNTKTPNRVLAYNWVDNSWSEFSQQFRCFGKYQTFFDTTWADLNGAVNTWDNTNITWNERGLQDDSPHIVAANDAGRVYQVYEGEPNGLDDTAAFNFEVLTKRFNPYLDKGRKCLLAYVDIYCTTTNVGQFTLDLRINDGGSSAVTRTVSTALTPPLHTQSAKYTRVFLNEIADFHQLRLYLTSAQMAVAEIAQSKIEIQGIVIWTAPSGRIKDLQ